MQPTPQPSVVELASALMRCPSVTPDDAGTQDVLDTYLQGLAATRIPIATDEPTSSPCPTLNSLWTWQPLPPDQHDTRPMLLFLGHTDVVAPGPVDAWDAPPFTPTLRDGQLIGRGAVDMKGAIAAFACAVARSAHTQGPVMTWPFQLAIALTSDEEGPGTFGAPFILRALQTQLSQPPYVLVGEPTSRQQVGDVYKTGRRGSLHGELTLTGHAGHVAYPQHAHNPFHDLGPVLEALTSVTWDDGDALCPATSLQVTRVQGDTDAVNVIPGSVTVRFNVRHHPCTSSTTIKAAVGKVLEDFQVQLAWLGGSNAYVATGQCLTERLHRATQSLGLTTQPSYDGGTSDARHFATWCPDILELGLCNALAHHTNERVPLADLERLTDLYTELLLTIHQDPLP